MRSAAEPPVVVRDIGAGVVLETAGFKITAAETDHIPFVGPARSLAYRVDSRYGSVVVSGDTAPCQAVIDLARDASVLVHECTFPPPGLAKSGTFSRPPEGRGPGTGHTTPIELGKLAAKAGVKKLVATHFGLYTRWPAAIEMTANFFGPDGVGPEVWPAIVGEIQKNYHGPIVIAEDALALRVGP
jgi:ribonuclease Z